MRLQTARLTHGIWPYRRAHETNWYFVRPCTLYDTLIEIVLFSLFRYVLDIFFFIIVASASPLIFGFCAESGLPNERTRLVRPVLFSPLKETKRILSSHGCCQSCCASGDEPNMFATMWWWHGWDSRIASSRHHYLLCHTYTHWQLSVIWGLLSFYLILSLPFIYLLPHLYFCFVSQSFGDKWHCLTSMHLSFLLPPHPTRWWYPAFDSSFNYPHGLIQPGWLLSIWKGFILIFKDRLSGL